MPHDSSHGPEAMESVWVAEEGGGGWCCDILLQYVRHPAKAMTSLKTTCSSLIAFSPQDRKSEVKSLPIWKVSITNTDAAVIEGCVPIRAQLALPLECVRTASTNEFSRQQCGHLQVASGLLRAKF